MTETARRLDLAARREREQLQREQLGDARHFYVGLPRGMSGKPWEPETCRRCGLPWEAEVHKVGSEDYK